MKGKITILINPDGTTIEVVDEKSSIRFIEIELTPEQLSAALSRLSMTDCTFEVKGLELLGKEHQCKNFEFEIPKSIAGSIYEDDGYEKRLSDYADSLLTDGWVSDQYFRSRGSFFKRGGKNFAKCTIRRYV